MSFLMLYLSLHLDPLQLHPDVPYFSHFHPDFWHSYTDSLHPHSHLIPRKPTLILRISLIPFAIAYFGLGR